MEYRSKKVLRADSQIPAKLIYPKGRYLLILGFLLSSVSSISQTVGAAPIRRVSGAPIGDTSIMVYPLGGMLPGQSMILKHPLLQDSVRVFGVTGSPSYFHLYRVDALPNVTCGLPSAASNRYFGVFTDPPNIQYNVTYYYGGNPYFNSMLEPLMALFMRNTNADIVCQAWSNAGASFYPIGDSVRKTPFTGRKEFILDHYSIAILPIELSSISVDWMDETTNKAVINWTTESEPQIAYFSIEKSTDADTWTEMYVQPAGGTANGPNQYAIIDNEAYHPVTYYRIKIVTNDGSSSVLPPLSLAHKRSSNQVIVYPNPAGEVVNIHFYEKIPFPILVEIRDETGQLIRTCTADSQKEGSYISLNTRDMQDGIYFLNLHEAIPGEPDQFVTILQTKIALLH